MVNVLSSCSVVLNLCVCVCAVQMGAGGFSVSLPGRSRRGRLLISREQDQGRGPGLQQRGQLHVTSAPLGTRRPTCPVAISSDHCTGNTAQEAHDDVTHANPLWASASAWWRLTFSLHSDGGTRERFHAWQIFSDTFKTLFSTCAGVICNRWCSILYCTFFCLTFWTYVWLKKGKIEAEPHIYD